MRRLVAVVVLLGIIAVGAALVLERMQPDAYQRLRHPLAFESLVRSTATTYDLDPALLAAVIASESAFDTDAVSPVGAIGLMQILPSTGESIANRRGIEDFDPATLSDPAVNLDFGAWYLRDLIDKYADHPQALDLALAAYNAGQGNVDAWAEATPVGEAVAIPYPETRAYVAKVLQLESIYREAWGLERPS